MGDTPQDENQRFWDDPRWTGKPDDKNIVGEKVTGRIVDQLENFGLEGKRILDVGAGPSSQFYFPNPDVLANVTAFDGNQDLLNANRAPKRVFGNIMAPFPKKLLEDDSGNPIEYDITTSFFVPRYIGKQGNSDETHDLRKQYINNLVGVTNPAGRVVIVDYVSNGHKLEIPFSRADMQGLVDEINQDVEISGEGRRLKLNIIVIDDEIFFPNLYGGDQDEGYIYKGDSVLMYDISFESR